MYELFRLQIVNDCKGERLSVIRSSQMRLLVVLACRCPESFVIFAEETFPDQR